MTMNQMAQFGQQYKTEADDVGAEEEADGAPAAARSRQSRKAQVAPLTTKPLLRPYYAPMTPIYEAAVKLMHEHARRWRPSRARRRARTPPPSASYPTVTTTVQRPRPALSAFGSGGLVRTPGDPRPKGTKIRAKPDD